MDCWFALRVGCSLLVCSRVWFVVVCCLCVQISLLCIGCCLLIGVVCRVLLFVVCGLLVGVVF